VVGADFLAAFVASCFLGAFPPVDLRAVCLVRAMVTLQGDDDDVPFFARKYGDDHKSQNRMSRYAQKKNENKKAVVSTDNGEDKIDRSSEGLQQNNKQNICNKFTYHVCLYISKSDTSNVYNVHHNTIIDYSTSTFYG
jgi:hypothetical protein